MRLRPRRLLQILVVCTFVLVYFTFFLTDNPSSLKDGTLEVKRSEFKLYFTERESNHTFTNISHSARSPNTASRLKSVYPNHEDYQDDRILTQLSFVPKSVQRGAEGGVKLKKILVYSGLAGWSLQPGQKTFLEQKCAVPYCELTDSRTDFPAADVVVFQGVSMTFESKMPHQKWLLFMLESPYHTSSLSSIAGLVNWTATYRHDSTIVAPYEKFVPYNASILTKPQNRNYAAGKTKKVAWFVSNCGARNNRSKYAEELAKYIQVDIYGACGTLQCPRFESNKCFDMLNTDYKFYLSFENSNCRDYISEKFFINGLKHDVIPIVMGAAPEDYERAAPPHSFIHVDQFESPKELAEYLHKLDSNDELYNQYFQWKGTGDTINTFFWCRVCALAHDEERGPSWYGDVEKWWSGDDICIGKESWRTKKRTSKFIADMPYVLPTNNL